MYILVISHAPEIKQINGRQQKRGFVIYDDLYEIANVYVIRSVSAVVCPVCQARTLYWRRGSK